MGSWRKRLSKPYLGSWDLEGGDLTVTIAKIDTWTDPRDRSKTKPILLFTEQVKPMLINATNGDVIQTMYGEDEAGWIGKKITVYVKPDVEFGGKTGPALRVRCIVNGQVQAPTESGPTAAEMEAVRAELAALKAKGSKKGRK